MTDLRLRLYQEEIRRRAADLRAIAGEFEIDVRELVERSRALRSEARRVREERRGARPS